jgi:hypothetical protein
LEGVGCPVFPRWRLWIWSAAGCGDAQDGGENKTRKLVLRLHTMAHQF